MEEAEVPLVVVFGPRGSGKSTLLRHLARRWPRRITLDPLGEHGAIGRRVSVEDLADEVLARPTGAIALRCDTMNEEDGADVADISLGLGKGMLFVDECDRWIHHHPMDPWFEHVECGRHYNVALFLGTRRPAAVWRNATANASRLYAFRTFEPRDVAYFRSFAGTAAAEHLARLPRYHYMSFDGLTGEVGTGIAPRSTW